MPIDSLDVAQMQTVTAAKLYLLQDREGVRGPGRDRDSGIDEYLQTQR